MLITTATELPRLMRCIGSRLMPAALPIEHRTEAMDEGNAAGWLAEQLFGGESVAVGAKAPNGWVVTDDMMENVHIYLKALDCGAMQVETTHGGEHYQVRGRADHIKFVDRIYSEYAGDNGVMQTTFLPSVLTIDDLKYGWRIVEPEMNWTLISHAIGWCINNRVSPDRIVLRIIQPRPYHPQGPVRAWACSYEELQAHARAIAARLTEPSDELTSGIEQCAKCHALAGCPAARRASMNAIDVVQDMAFSDDLPNDILAHEYEVLDQAADMVEMVRDARKELLTHRIQSGQVVQGYALKQRQGQRAWIAGMSGKALSAATGVDLVKDGVVTPAEAERRGVDKALVTALTSRPIIGTKLERINADAIGRKIFGTQ